MKGSTSKNILQRNQENLERELMFQYSDSYVDSDYISEKEPSTVVNLDELSIGDKSNSKKKKIGKDKRLFIHFCNY